MGQHYVSPNCTSLSDTCLVENTIYGYAPSLGFNAFFLAFFALCALIQLPLGIRYRTPFFTTVLLLGCLGEVTGYIGRIIMNHNPYSDVGFEIQISCLIFSPAFIAAGVYLTLQRVVETFGTERSRIPPRLYTWGFITCDFISLLLQAIGGGVAASAGDDAAARDVGTNLMIAGIVWQVATLLVFGVLAIDYAVRTELAWDQVPGSAKVLARKTSFRCFAWGVVLAFTTILARCVYRIAEMVGGWANPIMRDQPSFIALEGFMIVIATLCLTAFHPGYCFPYIAKRKESASSIQVDEEKVKSAPSGFESTSS